jgi:hypothetical protein
MTLTDEDGSSKLDKMVEFMLLVKKCYPDNAEVVKAISELEEVSGHLVTYSKCATAAVIVG